MKICNKRQWSVCASSTILWILILKWKISRRRLTSHRIRLFLLYMYLKSNRFTSAHFFQPQNILTLFWLLTFHRLFMNENYPFDVEYKLSIFFYLELINGFELEFVIRMILVWYQIKLNEFEWMKLIISKNWANPCENYIKIFLVQ